MSSTVTPEVFFNRARINDALVRDASVVVFVKHGEMLVQAFGDVIRRENRHLRRLR